MMRATPIREMDVGGAAFTGAPPEDWPAICAGALVMELSHASDQVEAAFPDDQAREVREEMERIAVGASELAGGGVAIAALPHRRGWTRLVLSLADGALVRTDRRGGASWRE